MIVNSPIVIAWSDSIGTLVVVPVVVAALTAVSTMFVTRAGEAVNRRRDRYAAAIQTLVAWIEFPYRVRRRTDDEPATLTALASRGHDLQERLACHEAWIATDHPTLARRFADARSTIGDLVSPAVREAWDSEPVATAAGMNLNGWGPGPTCMLAVTDLRLEIERRFGLRRIRTWVRT